MKNYLTSIDPFFSRFFLGEENRRTLMNTDIKEYKDHYEMKVDLPSIKKEDIKISLDDGYLNISASYKEEKESSGEYLYHERNYEEVSRSYYLGKSFTLKDLSASLEDGVLTINILKVKEKQEEKYLQID